MYVLYGTVKSDHIPLVAHIDLQLAPDIDQGATNNMGNKIDWSILSEDILYEYGVQSEILLSNVEIPTDVILCKDCNCNNVEHNQNQNQKCFYSILTKSIYKVTMKRFWIRGPLLRPAWSLT